VEPAYRNGVGYQVLGTRRRAPTILRTSMSQTAISLLTLALCKAHAMESHALKLLERRAAQLERFPEIQAQIQHHLGETERQLGRIEDCLDALGEETPRDHDASSGAAPVHLALAADGELLDEAFADFALESYEIAAYRSLLTLCEVAVQRSIAPLLQETLKEEEAMARWLKDNLSRLTRDYVVECERKAGNGEEEETGAATKIKPPRPDVGGQRGQGDERDHEPSKPPPRKENRTRRGGAK
jgi:ferritin-like metal-binding protein YciE